MYDTEPVSKFCNLQETNEITLIHYGPSQNINFFNRITEL